MIYNFETLKQLLFQSSSFKLLSPEEQANLINLYQQANDLQIFQAIEEIKKTIQEERQIQQEQQQQAASKATEIQHLIKEIKADELKQQQLQEQANSDQEALNVLNQLDKLTPSSNPKFNCFKLIKPILVTIIILTIIYLTIQNHEALLKFFQPQ